MHPLYVGSSILIAVFLVAILWDLLDDLRGRMTEFADAADEPAPSPPAVRTAVREGDSELSHRHRTTAERPPRLRRDRKLNPTPTLRRPRI